MNKCEVDMKTSVNEGLVIKILQTDGTSIFNGTCSCRASFSHSNVKQLQLRFYLERTVAVT